MTDTAPNDAGAVTSVRAAAGVVVVAGAVLLAWPRATVLVLAAVTGLGAAALGVQQLAGVFAGADQARIDLAAGLLALVSIFGGFVVFVTAFVSTTAVQVVLGLFWVALGGVQLVAGYLRSHATVDTTGFGLATLAAGLIALLVPAASVIVLAWVAGLWLVLVGGLGLLVGGRRDAEVAPS